MTEAKKDPKKESTVECAMSVLCEARVIFNKMGLPVILDGGTVVGFKRDGRFCDGDHIDIDFTTLEQVELWRDKVVQAFEESGYCLVGDKPRDVEKHWTTQLSFRKDGIIIDIMFKECVGDMTWWSVGFGQQWKAVPTAFYQEPEKLKLSLSDGLSVTFNIPHDSDTYLAYRYGDWHKPCKKGEYTDGAIVEGGYADIYRGITFGAFDPLHYGHIKLFERATETCTSLIVCVSDNEYIEKHKGHAERFPLAERMSILRNVKNISVVDTQTLAHGKQEAIAQYTPRRIFVGDDHKDNFTGEGLGVPVVYLPRTQGVSSSGLVANFNKE
jgi:glycerol-3-phosphate cytidylyltransferase